MKLLRSVWFPVCIIVAAFIAAISEMGGPSSPRHDDTPTTAAVSVWQPPDISTLGNDSTSLLIKYGRELIANTARYLGPKGRVAALSNGMNCQNCHLEAGARPYGNCFASVAATYPAYKPRSGIVESIEYRINDCMLRSMNGNMIDSKGKEMRAMVAYLKWLGKEVPPHTRPTGSGVEELAFLPRAASAAKGQALYVQQCARCHGQDGEGQPAFDTGYAYPPLWGEHSYNTGAGLFRLSKLAAYIRENMPFGTASHAQPQLSVEEAWDLAAFINTQARPEKQFAGDWPDIARKAFDYPYGPYTDGFSALQHKYGPFDPIKKAADQRARAANK